MATVKFVKGTVAQYTSGKSTYDVDGTIFIATDKPYIYAWGQQIGVDAADLIDIEGKEAITVTGDNEKVVALKLAAANKILSQSTEGLTASLSFKDDSEAKEIQLIGANNAVVDKFSYEKFVVDGMLADVKLEGNNLVFTFNTDAGQKTIDPVDLSKYIDTYEAGDGIELSSKKINIKIEESEKYLEVDEDGLATKGIDNAISEAVAAETTRATGKEKELGDKITALESKVGSESVEGQIEGALDELDLTEVGGEGKYIKTVKQENGQVSATAEDLTAANVKATAVTGGSATNVQGVLEELAGLLQWKNA